ncbi:MAG: dihydrofolate reductase [Tissierellia bacterium]|jgi:phosphoglycerate dehydrogenase-like enzyme|nr:dihydrofolate reductase [Tissierellia bacterium]
MKVLYCTPITPEGEKRVTELGYNVLVKKEKDLLQEDLQGVDVLVGMNPFAMIDVTKGNLQFIQLQSQGFDHLPKKSLDGVTVANNQGGYAIPIGEWIVAKILESYKHTRNIYRLQEERLWKKDFGMEELTGKKILFVGTGTIASEAAKRLQGFGVEIYGANRSGKAAPFIENILSLDKLDEILPEIDVLVPVLPWTKQTEDLISARMIEALKPGSVFINISRGQIVDEKALIENVDKFLAVHLDVTKDEPLPSNSPLWEKENVYISGHTSWVSQFVDKRRDDLIYENLRRFIQGESLLNIVDVRRGY